MQPILTSEHSANGISRKEIAILMVVFILSRITIHLAGLQFQYDALYKYWQYLDVSTLKHNLINGVWYDHTQPPVFNLFLGSVLKITGSQAPAIFAGLLKLISLINAIILLSIIKKLVSHRFLPLGFALVYLLSPATMVLENELFYTSFITLLFLVCSYYMIKLRSGINWKNATGIFLSLLLICLTRSMYHLLLLLLLSAVLIFSLRRRNGLKKLAVTGAIAILITAGWYLKNYCIFNQFSASSWIGMNMARNIFHDNEVKDSSRIEAFEPFLPVSSYSAFVDDSFARRYAGLNDKDLLQEWKNDSLRNEKHINFLRISQLYLEAGKKHIKDHPVSYLKNVIQSSIIFFAPATRYTVTEKQARKIKYYDLVYSFNPSVFAEGKQQRRIAMTVSAIPQILIYLFVLFTLIHNIRKKKQISLLDLFIAIVIGYVFITGSLLEHYENMRFRFELQPLFYILLAQAIYYWLNRRKGKPFNQIQ